MAASDDDADLALLTSFAREAAALALTFFGQAPKSWTKSGNSPVSEADIAIDRLLHDLVARIGQPREPDPRDRVEHLHPQPRLSRGAVPEVAAVAQMAAEASAGAAAAVAAAAVRWNRLRDPRRLALSGSHRDTEPAADRVATIGWRVRAAVEAWVAVSWLRRGGPRL